MKNILFDSYQLGPLALRNRAVMAPLTRSRATREGVPTGIMAVYYAQRANAGLIISEGVVISPQGVAYPRVPGLYNDEQVKAWRLVTDAVHERGGVIFAQLWHVGRQSHSRVQPDGLPPYAPSPVRIRNYRYNTRPDPLPYETPRELTREGITEIVWQFADAAERAIAAGFDGVELHGANGYLIDQFLNSTSNQRTDEYGGPLENRTRFLHEILEAISGRLSLNRVGVRLSPSSTWMDAEDGDKRALHAHVIASLNRFNLAYLHLVEPRIAGSTSTEAQEVEIASEELAAIFEGTVITTGEHTLQTAQRALSGGLIDLIGFGRSFISNPDLPMRLEEGEMLTEPDRRTFYAGREQGYIDYPSRAAEKKWRDRERCGHDLSEIYADLDNRSLLDLERTDDLYSYYRLRALASEAVLNK